MKMKLYNVINPKKSDRSYKACLCVYEKHNNLNAITQKDKALIFI